MSSNKDIDEIISQLKVAFFRISDLDVTYRTINHYNEKDLIFSDRTNSKMWRRFNGFQAIWIKIIEQLRIFGVSLENINILKNNIFHESKLGYIDKAHFINRPFEEEIANSIKENYNLYLIVFSDFSYTYHDSRSSQQWTIKSYKEESHINIPLRNIVQDIWRSSKRKLKENNLTD
jgi:DNA-binding transcriptional MerR regulator